ncbi:glycosyltransferase family 4 protein [Parabacteroides sp. FAFU027]|uniref:glycosyltransferase family 4 protein n=1 Tax=Parabacteroides sp. FAFU027 TaxID=2922715 RepID=UPI001FAF1D4F|nr:glycosyltransferase family 4 protein [Parabacteroides sp. FAFU027]
MKKLAIITTHPIQYNAPWFKMLAERKRIQVKVFYTWSQAKDAVQDKTFGQEIKWDIPLLDGYEYEFVENRSTDPGTHHKNGIDCPGLIRAVEQWNPDEVLVFGWYLKSHLEVMKHFKGKLPVNFRGDSTLLNERFGIKTVLRRVYLRYIYRYVDRAFYVGIENKKYFQAHGLKEEQLVFAPHAIDNDRFFDSEEKQYEQQAKAWRHRLGYNDDDIVVLFCGKLYDLKNPELLISAVQQINDELQAKGETKRIKLLMVGSGPLESTLREMVGSDIHITFLPFQNQSAMPVVYRLGNIYCLPSRSETWGLAVNEAMACSRAVMVSDKVGCANDLVSGEYGAIFRSGDHADLKEKLNLILNQDISKMGIKAREVIEAWNFENICKAIEATKD